MMIVRMTLFCLPPQLCWTQLLPYYSVEVVSGLEAVVLALAPVFPQFNLFHLRELS